MEKKEPSDFLKKLQSVVESGDQTKGLDVIKKINDIHKLADGLNFETATNKIDKRIEEVGTKKELSPLEREKITLEAEKEKIKREEEEFKLIIQSNIENSKFNIIKLEKEFEKSKKEFENSINLEKEKLINLKITYEAKYDEKYE